VRHVEFPFAFEELRGEVRKLCVVLCV